MDDFAGVEEAMQKSFSKMSQDMAKMEENAGSDPNSNFQSYKSSRIGKNFTEHVKTRKNLILNPEPGPDFKFSPETGPDPEFWVRVGFFAGRVEKPGPARKNSKINL